ncbi:uncharacterized protein LOC111268527 [Varroa jacobsoni]|uniref:uncharacterized protein LOC111268527 n=1 Tax=Varroa jacobsoni TaxID=62625 RepID=UPI000BF84154|nr:uncharacterized protein LOC111268527 [Varroa jacobsoni]
MELESYTNVILRQSLRELLSPHSPLWPEVKVFMSICKSAGQRLPPEVQVWNMMNVRKGLKRLLRLSPLYGSTDGVVDTSKSNKIELKAVRTSGAKCEDHDPVQVKLLLRWIVERIEIAAAYALQRLRIGHQVNWISALLASLARIRQFCIEILEKLEHKIVKHSATKQHFDEGVPLDRATFVQLKAGLSAKSQLKLSSANARSSETATDVKSQVNIPSSSTTIQRGKRQRSTAIKEQACGIAKTSDDARQQGSNAEKSDTCVTKEKQSKHPIIIELRSHIKQLMKGKSAMTKTALKKIYGIALKRSRFYAAGDDRSIRKLCKVALHKAQASVNK